MTSTDIDNLVNESVSMEKVIERMLEMNQIECTSESESIKLHKKAASYSECQCAYCSVIKQYVHAKRKVRYLERTESDFDSPILKHARQRLSDMFILKQRAKITPINEFKISPIEHTMATIHSASLDFFDGVTDKLPDFVSKLDPALFGWGRADYR